jgi:UTP--glucose-1-phosphate uridylyltransferase
MQEVKKIIIPISDFGNKFLPLSRVVPKELWPLRERPVIEYLLQEAKDTGLDQIIFVMSEEKKIVLNYLKSDPNLKKLLKDNNDDQGLKALEILEELLHDLKFTSVKQAKSLGHGHAVLQASSKILKDEAFGVMTSNNIVESEVPCMQQLIDIHDTSQKPVIALKKVTDNDLSATRVRVDKIANRVFKIKKILTGGEDSDLAIVGKYILTPEIFGFLKNNTREEITLADTFSDMLQAGKTIYGYEFEGTHLEVKDKDSYVETSKYLLNK